jgi:hypothetical protein
MRLTTGIILLLGLLALGVLALSAFRAPLFDCPACAGGTQPRTDEDDPSEDAAPIPCSSCEDHRRLTLMGRWLAPPVATAPNRAEPPVPSIDGLSAEQIFATLEDRTVHARTLRVKFRSARLTPDAYQRFERDGTLILGERGDARLILRTQTEDGVSWERTISDGTTLWRNSNWLPRPILDNVPDNFRSGLAAQIFRIGVQPTPGSPLEGGSSILGVSDIRSGPEVSGTRSLVWRIRVPDTGQHSESTLWFDSATLRPLRRRLTTTITGQPLVAEEVYEVFSLEPVLPDWKFTIPR